MYFLRRLFYYLTYPLRALFSSPMALFSAPRRLLGMSLPMRAAVLVAVFLIILTVAFVLAAIFLPMAADWRNLFGSLPRVLLIIALLIVIPVIVYWAMKLWLEGDVSRFPDIDRDWNAGMAALAEQGIDLTETPIFLVLGVDDEQHAKSLFRASQVSLRVHDVPEGPGTLHWYANPEAVYLVCTGVGQLAKLYQVLAKSDAKGALAGDSGPRSGKRRARGTIVVDGGDEDTVGPGTISDQMRQQLSSMDIAGTMMVPDSFNAASLASAAHGTPARTVQMPLEEASDGTQRLEYVCQLLRRVRQPVCAMNGVLSLISYGLIKRGTEVAGQIQAATKNDLATLSGGFQLRFPVVAMIAGMESDDGFRELVRRVGPDEAKLHRFGKGFNVWNDPHPEQIEAVAAHACAAFEDWTYSLFRQRDGQNHPGNRKLYSLLCTIRSHLREPLTDILATAYGHDPEKDRAKSSLPMGFGGCYFAATGDTEDRQAFVQSVFRKLVEMEEELEWSDAALVENERYQRLASAATVICGLLVAGWIGMLLLKYVILG